MGAASPDARPIRSFVAIEVEEPVRTAVVAYLADLRRRLDDVAWTRPENLHLTLKFLGGVTGDRLKALADDLEVIAAAQPSFSMQFSGVGAFPNAARPHVLWVGASAAALPGLASAVDTAARRVGVAPEARPFHPHVTLGRVRERRGVAARGAGMRDLVAADRSREFGAAAAAAIVLFRSDTGPGGARHTPLARAPLRG